MKAKQFIYHNKEKIEEMLSYKYNIKSIYDTFIKSEKLPTPTFSLRYFQKLMKEIYTDKKITTVKINKPNNKNTSKVKSELKESNLGSQIKKPKKKTFEYDPLSKNLDEIE